MDEGAEFGRRGEHDGGAVAAIDEEFVLRE